MRPIPGEHPEEPADFEFVLPARPSRALDIALGLATVCLAAAAAVTQLAQPCSVSWAASAFAAVSVAGLGALGARRLSRSGSGAAFVAALVLCITAAVAVVLRGDTATCARLAPLKLARPDLERAGQAWTTGSSTSAPPDGTEANSGQGGASSHSSATTGTGSGQAGAASVGSGSGQGTASSVSSIPIPACSTVLARELATTRQGLRCRGTCQYECTLAESGTVTCTCEGNDCGEVASKTFEKCSKPAKASFRLSGSG